MARANRLTVKSIERLGPGRYSDGGRGSFGLYLLVQPRAGGGLRRSWAQRIRVAGRETNIGLGSYPVVTLPMARQKALENRRIAHLGGDPKCDRLTLTNQQPGGNWSVAPAPVIATPSPSFREAARRVIELRSEGWTGSRTAHKWWATINQHAAALMDRPIADVTSAEVMRVLSPLWHSKPATAKTLRQRISTVMRWAIAEGHRSDDPAGDTVLAALPRHSNGVRHHGAAEHQQIANTLRRVREARASPVARLALEFVILTAARSVEVRDATWTEIDREEATWTVPAERSKIRRPHRVPLSAQALQVLDRAADHASANDPLAQVFPGSRRGGPMSGTSLLELVKVADPTATVHGFRSSFRSWAADNGVDRDLAEAALAHTVKGVEGAYQRSDLYDRRRTLMQEWADYVTRERDALVRGLNRQPSEKRPP